VFSFLFTALRRDYYSTQRKKICRTKPHLPHTGPDSDVTCPVPKMIHWLMGSLASKESSGVIISQTKGKLFNIQEWAHAKRAALPNPVTHLGMANICHKLEGHLTDR
jgi:hypothetical protein